MAYSYAFFDLDGTLTDSSAGILNSVQYALQKLGIESPPRKLLTGFIGPPLARSFSQYFQMNQQEAQHAVDTYREYYAKKGMLECTVYEGIRELLEELNRRGVSCVLATCKPHYFAKRILVHYGLDSLFSFVSGPEINGTRGEKHEVISHAMEHLDIQDPSRILMIGDRDNDVLGAKKHGIDCVGVLWGFGSAEELTEAGAKALCPTPRDLLEFFP
ncbi:MAG: HAD family hydrolase [Clostridia bacterium]|nr:HAD family hydrolase [Clostridia bacterium]